MSIKTITGLFVVIILTMLVKLAFDYQLIGYGLNPLIALCIAVIISLIYFTLPDIRFNGNEPREQGK